MLENSADRVIVSPYSSIFVIITHLTVPNRCKRAGFFFARFILCLLLGRKPCSDNHLELMLYALT